MYCAVFTWLTMPKLATISELVRKKCTCTNGNCMRQFENASEAVLKERQRFQSLDGRHKETWRSFTILTLAEYK